MKDNVGKDNKTVGKEYKAFETFIQKGVCLNE